MGAALLNITGNLVIVALLIYGFRKLQTELRGLRSDLAKKNGTERVD